MACSTGTSHDHARHGEEVEGVRFLGFRYPKDEAGRRMEDPQAYGSTLMDLWDNSKPYSDPLLGRILTRPAGQRVAVRGHSFNGTILRVVHGETVNPHNGRRQPRGSWYEVEHDNGDIKRWSGARVSSECPLEALAKMAKP